MASKDPWLPSPKPLRLTKSQLLDRLLRLDGDTAARDRVLRMEIDFRRRIDAHVSTLLPKDAQFSKFNTNPFVLLIHSLKKSYRHVCEIEQDILPAKQFSSMETSAGRMVEQVVFRAYKWEFAPSAMHTANSLIDGKQLRGDTLRIATLKSGPRCLNDPTSANIADMILANVASWAASASVSKVEVTYGVLYGTQKQSNKKDWRILRCIWDKLAKKQQKYGVSPEKRWHTQFVTRGVDVNVNVRIGVEWWGYLADDDGAFLEMACAMIRACVVSSNTTPPEYEFTIRDLKAIISLDVVPDEFNVSLLQRSQLEWLFFFVRHFCDEFGDSEAGTGSVAIRPARGKGGRRRPDRNP